MLPIPIDRPVTLPTQEERTLKRYVLTIAQWEQVVSVVGMMTIQTPEPYAPMVQANIGMYQQVLLAPEIDREIPFRSMTGSTWRDGLRQRPQWYREFLLRVRSLDLLHEISVFSTLGTHKLRVPKNKGSKGREDNGDTDAYTSSWLHELTLVSRPLEQTVT
jgi:hypothetical protein